MGYVKRFFSTISLVLLFFCQVQAVNAVNVTLDQAVANVKKDKENKVLGAETIQLKGKMVHQIKVLTKDGHVKKIQVDTKSD